MGGEALRRPIADSIADAGHDVSAKAGHERPGASPAGRMEALHSDTPSPVPVRMLALVTSLTCLLAHLLSRAGGLAGGAHGGPPGVVLGQAVWNAAQVGLLLLLLCLWRVRRGWGVIALAIATLACLPFAIYAISPGAWVLSTLLLTTCALAWAWDVPDLGVAITDAPARGTPTLAKLEFLAIACNLFSSMYNYGIGRGIVPYWHRAFREVAAFVGFTPDTAAIAHGMYTLGLHGVSLPPYILPARENPLASVAFLLIWTVLPTLYVLYFAACAKLAKYSFGTRVQQALCLYCIFHFLFLTDIVDYQFGRGIVNPLAEWSHWSERYVWRIAILLPIYQSLASGHWRKGNGATGVVVHYALAVWAVMFLIYQPLIHDGEHFYRFVTGREFLDLGPFWPAYFLLGYPTALVFMTLFYGFLVLTLRCKRVQAQPMTGSPGECLGGATS